LIRHPYTDNNGKKFICILINTIQTDTFKSTIGLVYSHILPPKSHVRHFRRERCFRRQRRRRRRVDWCKRQIDPESRMRRGNLWQPSVFVEESPIG
jgi:hypothetical protein